MKHRIQAFAILLYASLANGCDQTPGPEEIGSIATVYAEILVAEQSATDSVTAHKKADSIAKSYGYSASREIIDLLKNTTIEPETLRKVLDSTQRYLERISRTPPGEKKGGHP